MERLTQADLHRLLTAIQELSRPLDLETLPQRIISVLPQVVPTDLVSYDIIDPVRQRFTTTFDPPGVWFPDADQIFLQHLAEHPSITYYQRTNYGRAVKISDFLSQRQFFRLGLYNEIYKRLGKKTQIAFTLPTPSPLLIGIVLSRNQRDFSERERRLLDLLRPHLIQVYRQAEVITQLRREAAQFGQELEESAAGFIFLSPQGQVRLCTARARRWVEAYFGRAACFSANRLPDSLQCWVTHQQALLTLDDDAPTPRIPLIIQRAGKRLIVRFFTDPDVGRHTLVLNEEQTTVSPKMLEPFGLTVREAEVLFWVA